MNVPVSGGGVGSLNAVERMKGMGPPAYAGPGLLAARGLVWIGGGVKSLVVG